MGLLVFVPGDPEKGGLENVSEVFKQIHDIKWF